MRAPGQKTAAVRRVYVLTLKTWKEYGRAHHTYGRIHWSDDDGFGAADSESLPDADGFTTSRHDTWTEAIALWEAFGVRYNVTRS